MDAIAEECVQGQADPGRGETDSETTSSPQAAAMRMLSLVFAVVLVLAGSQAELVAAVPPVSAPLIEAESTGTGQIVAMAECSGGQAVTATRAWEPLLRIGPPPAAWGEASLWIRQRGGPVQVKGMVGDTQTAFAWQWARPATWEWRECGPFPRATVADGALVIRGDIQDGADPCIDVAQWLPAGAPSPVDSWFVVACTVSVDWNAAVATTTGFSFGINAFHGFDPLTTALPAYQKGMQRLDCGLIRLHSAELFSGKGPNTWVDGEKKTWLGERIRSAMAKYPRGTHQGNVALMLNISNWPAWFDADQDGFLDADQFDAYAAWCADLVRLVNIEAHGEVLWWEITNELDDRYHNHLVANGQPSRMAELSDIWLRAALAMKQVDPRIRTGGPALIRPDLPESLAIFLRKTREQLDFVTYHAYASGSADDADAHILGPRIQAIGGTVAAIDVLIHREIGHGLPHFLDEYNISWTWETRDPRMTSAKGAVFDALVLAASTSAGADGTCAWNEWDGVYGKFAGDGTARPQVGVFARLNAWGRGTIVKTNVTPEGDTAHTSAELLAVVPFAVTGAAGRLLMLINRSNTVVSLSGSIPWSTAEVERIDAAGEGVVTAVSERMQLPPYSVTFYHWPHP